MVWFWMKKVRSPAMQFKKITRQPRPNGFLPKRRHFDKCVSRMIHQRLYYFGMVSGKVFPSPVLCAPPRPNNTKHNQLTKGHLIHSIHSLIRLLPESPASTYQYLSLPANIP